MPRAFLKAVPLSLWPLLAIACDPQARSAPPRGEVLARSQEHESCAATADCETPLRCIAHVCRRPAGSRLGEYYMAAGELASSRGDVDRAAQAFQQALSQYEADRLEPPPAAICAYGGALVQKTGDPKAAEQAARLLHRCLLASPPGSSERDRALRALAKLEPLGLDPTLLARDTPADTYLTRPPSRPSVDSLKLDVQPAAAAREKGYAAWVKALAGDSVKNQVAGCFGDFYLATQKARLSLTIGFEYKARFDPDEEMYLPGTLAIDAPPAGDAGPEARAAQCVREAIGPLAQSFAAKATGTSWSGSALFTLASAP